MHQTNTPTSDVDIRAIICTPSEMLLNPFYVHKDTVHSTATIDGQTYDTVTYELRHFVKMVSQGNPTMLEALLSNVEEVTTPHGTTMYENFDKFINPDTAVKHHLGYANAMLRETARTGIEPATKKELERQNRRHGKQLSAAIIATERIIRLSNGYQRFYIDATESYPFTPAFHTGLKQGRYLNNGGMVLGELIHNLESRKWGDNHYDERFITEFVIEAYRDA